MRNEQGFTLVSVMIAIVLVAVGLLALLGTQVSTYAMQTHANARTGAVEVARAYMEELKSRDPRTLVAAASDEEQVNDAGEIASDGAYTRSVAVRSGGDFLKEVKVTVDFPKATAPVELVTLVYHKTF